MEQNTQLRLGQNELVQMVGLYKGKLADAEEQVITYQALIISMNKEKEILQEQVRNLQNQIVEMTSPVESCPDLADGTNINNVEEVE